MVRVSRGNDSEASYGVCRAGRDHVIASRNELVSTSSDH